MRKDTIRHISGDIHPSKAFQRHLNRLDRWDRDTALLSWALGDGSKVDLGFDAIALAQSFMDAFCDLTNNRKDDK